MANFIRLDNVRPADSRPVVDRADPMAPATGALLLVEPQSPYRPWGPGVPASGAAVPNVAGATASRLLNVAPSAVQPTVDYQGISSTSSTKGLLQRTGKGGMHAIMSTTVAPASGDGFRVRVPTAILNYIATNPTNDIYVSLWGRITRLSEAALVWSAIALTASPSATNLLYAFGNDGNTFPTSSPPRLGARRDPPNSWRPSYNPNLTPRPFILNAAFANNSGTIDATRGSKLFAVGAHGAANEPFAGPSAASQQVSGALYRYYMEDLTVSGRTYAQVDKLDSDLYVKEVLTAGGRYFDDTYTQPGGY
ncbi:hypothetical protein [Frigoribacterium sp. CFBP9030]|uniref:hypothetical protein n=1 Tax=Frigoribacterium sp. CFBP9030 TaxID=3096537 RepID=UPI002A69BA9D|nr:hypothetical protein [Frigoribacterium sp. CFBP9030]MDY0891889.1 hypothetical protein [Frigoribacterium sp. CFBP9030]